MNNRHRHPHRLSPRVAASLLVALVTLVLVPAASAHVPIGSGGNESLATARRISDPLKSWAIYGDLLGGGQAQYYTFDIAQGQSIHLSLLTTTDAADAAFAPSVVLLGPGLPSQGAVPGGLQAPPGAGWLVVTGAHPAQATYEPFGPSAYVQLADLALDAPASGTYYFAVQAAGRGGHYGVAIGDRESFTLSEWLSSPFSLLTVYTWERQSLLLVLAPAAAVMALGVALLARRAAGGAGRRLDRAGWLAALAGLLFLGTSATVVSQMLLSISRAPVDGEVTVTLIFAGLPLVLGGVSLWLAVGQPDRRGLRFRMALALLAAAGLALWAGYWLGPALALVAALAPAARPHAVPKTVPGAVVRLS